MEGVVKAGDKIKMMATGKEFEVSDRQILLNNYL